MTEVTPIMKKKTLVNTLDDMEGNLKRKFKVIFMNGLVKTDMDKNLKYMVYQLLGFKIN